MQKTKISLQVTFGNSRVIRNSESWGRWQQGTTPQSYSTPQTPNTTPINIFQGLMTSVLIIILDTIDCWNYLKLTLLRKKVPFFFLIRTRKYQTKTKSIVKNHEIIRKTSMEVVLEMEFRAKPRIFRRRSTRKQSEEFCKWPDLISKQHDVSYFIIFEIWRKRLRVSRNWTWAPKHCH